ncbi:rhomboid family intramembrane serine protease [Halodurantibacterium flavum]|uniref:Rhomboid family intramembrane serine protease n=1 Tax=Halodurantibacterium flavum TaxID=1382802 RepID=A0ABW4S5X5_9RHOB
MNSKGHEKMRDGGVDEVPSELWLLLGAMALVECVLFASDSGFAPEGLRRLALLYGAFWPQLLQDVTPVWQGQQFAMFVTHAFLHGGFAHMAMNGVILLALGKDIASRVGPGRMLIVFALSAIAGGVAYALLSSDMAPMIGASGAAFGFLGAWQFREARTRLRFRLTLRPVLAAMVALVVANIALTMVMGGAIAWQAHLGGFIAGFALGPMTVGRGLR